MPKLRNKVALITGAGGSIGRATALKMAQEGAYVIASDIDEDLAARTAELVRQEGGQSAHLKLDVRLEDDWANALHTIESDHQRLDILVNNAGICAPQSIFTSDYAAWRWHMDVEIDGRFLGCKLAIPLMARSGSGSVVNIASTSARVGAPGLAAYATAKAGVCALSKAVAADCVAAGYKIRVNTVLPGGTKSAIWVKMAYGGALPEGGAPDYDDIITQHTSVLSSLNPLGRPGDPEDIADAVSFLASDEARYINGVELLVDGGSSSIRANPSVPKDDPAH